MSRLAAALVCLALAGCGEEEPPLDAACTASARDIVQALRTAPGATALGSGTLLSQCVERAGSDAELQTLGLVLTTAAETLARRAEDGGTQAALQLGYLAGTVRRGAARTSGIHAELERRVARAAAFLDAEPAPVQRALLRGLAAGEARG